MQGTSRSELAAELERCARLCEETALLYVERHRDGVRTDVVSSLLLAAAALDTAVKSVEEDDGGTALLIASTLAAEAVAAAERRGLDESLLRCVPALRRVAALCDRELGRP
jgi:hypothetical protein